MAEARVHRDLPGIARSAIAIVAALGLISPVTAQEARLFVDSRSTTIDAAARLEGEARRDALLLARFPSATWFTGGTPAAVEAKVRELVDRAAAEGKLPVLVAYNIPFRDCALYSAGGAANSAAYLDWIRGFAAGIGERDAIVILEPDGLGVIPWHRTLSGELEACRPAGREKDGATAERFAQLRGAVDILSSRPRARVYLDGTTSSWLSPAEAASRLVQADVNKTAGFFLNVSNYEDDRRLSHYARWISDCIALVTRARLDPRQCPSQYHPARFDDVSSWRRTDRVYDRLFDAARLRRDPSAQKHAVIDTSRNGLGSWQPKAGRYRDAEVWCNPPGRGLGRRPTLDTGNAYVDAFLWIKVPGESDGQCHRGTGGPGDPERGVVAPAAGGWFAQQARELIELAMPPLRPD
ncbi:cellulase [Sphingomonas koreensis]|uniref:glycoside hydrolase family 6 protein n=1 Tax=Sphingomonas koreensis TaxID=93064 RepID=UPI000A06805D|nr:glycoside hydrolase family 6 protein [Sphingomonas koreensis]PJI87912.1 endoglucanase [Sphingomonas koreensis]RSU55914.1 cellulase [Sphingomonas koreensis]RSU66088.1 cellulase [Sphingomonas koreensis]